MYKNMPGNSLRITKTTFKPERVNFLGFERSAESDSSYIYEIFWCDFESGGRYGQSWFKLWPHQNSESIEINSSNY